MLATTRDGCCRRIDRQHLRSPAAAYNIRGGAPQLLRSDAPPRQEVMASPACLISLDTYAFLNNIARVLVLQSVECLY